MPRAGSVNDSSFSSPRTPKAPWILPRRINFRADGASDCIVSSGRRWRPAQSGRSGLLGVLLVQIGDLVAHLRALAKPVLDALGVELDALLGTGGDRVVVTDAPDVAAVAGAAAVGDDDVVEGALLGAARGKADLDQVGLGVAQRPGRTGGGRSG